MFTDLSSFKKIESNSINLDIPEIVLSDDIREKLKKILEEEELISNYPDRYVKVSPTSTLLKLDNYVFFSNLWCYLAVLCKKLAFSLYPYCEFYDTNVRNKKEIINLILEENIEELKLKLEIEPEDVRRLILFIKSDDVFRPGKELINKANGQNKERACKDIFSSCILAKIPVPNASFGYFGNLVYYLSKHEDVYNQLENEINNCLNNTSKSTPNSKIRFVTGIKPDIHRNRIIFGAPGTGKSYKLNEDRKELLGADNENDYERVTFHPDYSYANFVGTYKPVMVEKSVAANVDDSTREVLEILKDPNRNSQEKYDSLYPIFGNDLTRLPILLGICSDDPFTTKKTDGSGTKNDNIVEKNHGISLRKFVQLRNIEESSTNDISYEYVPGPFMRMYVKALKSARSDNPRPFLLIIEEINRANMAAVFGDIFQLLDRGEDNTSEYAIQASEDIKKYLAKELGGSPDDYSSIRIPDNLFIWATMNSADQGVFPMDTAFKRRWNFTYIGIDENDSEISGKYVEVGKNSYSVNIEWNSLRKAINNFLTRENINEDKLLGPYFISKSIVVPPNGGTIIDEKKFCEAFKHKVIMYLFDDAAKQRRNRLFEGIPNGSCRYSKICELFDKEGINIFSKDISENVKFNTLKAKSENLNNDSSKEEISTEEYQDSEKNDGA